MSKTLNYILVFLVFVALAGVFYAGYTTYPKRNPCPQIASDTVYVYDTVLHIIPDTVPYLIVKQDSIKYRDQAWIDSIVQANKVDTAALMAQFYALHYYTRYWNDTLLSVTQRDVLSQNKFVESSFTYKLLKPLQIINNVSNNYTTYNKYLYVGVNTPIRDFNYTTFDLTYAFPSGYLGAGYNKQLNSMSFKVGVRLWKWD